MCEGTEDPPFQGLGHDFPPGDVVVWFGQAVCLVIRRDLRTVKQAGEYRGVGMPTQLIRMVKVLVGVIETGHQRTPVQHR